MAENTVKGETRQIQLQPPWNPLQALLDWLAEFTKRPLLKDLTESKWRKIEASDAVDIDLPSAFYPELEVSVDRLKTILKEEEPTIAAGTLLVFRTDQKISEKFRTSLASALSELKAAGVIKDGVQFYFRVDPDPDHEELRAFLNKTVGIGQVTKKEINDLTALWDDDTAR